MPFDFAGRYGAEAMLSHSSGSDKPSLYQLSAIYVRHLDATLATLYTDRTKAAVGPNPVLTDADGNLTFFADPGPYLISGVALGVEQAGRAVTVEVDPEEVGSDDEVAAAVAAEAALRSAADALLIPLAQRAAANGVATLGADSKVPSAQLPDVAISDFLGVVGSQAAMLALAGEQGDWAIRSDLSTTWIIVGSDPTQLADWQELPTPVDAVLSVNGRTGTVVGLAEAADVVEKALFDANTVLAADADNTPAAVTMASSTILARLAAGNIKAATPAEIKTLLAIAEADVSGLVSDLAAKVAKSTFDANTVLKADTDDTPVALPMGASTILARLAAGGIVAATPAELKTLLAIAESDVTNLVTDLSNKASVADLSSEISARQTGDNTLVPNNQTTDYALVLADMGKVVEINAATAKNLTVPTNVSAAFPVNSIVWVQQMGAGAITIVPAGGVTLVGAVLTSTGAGSGFFLRKTATNTWSVEPHGSVAFTEKGAWATTTVYVVGDVVTQDGLRYLAATAHTSGTFATDLAAAKWVALDSGTTRAADLLSRRAGDVASVYTLSAVTPTVTASAAGAATSIVNGKLRKPKGTGASSPVDVDGDQAFFYVGGPTAAGVAYGAASPDWDYVRPNYLTGGSGSSVFWPTSVQFLYDGQVFEMPVKAFATTLKYRMKIDGRYVTEAVQSIAGLAAGSQYQIKFDLGSGGVERLIEIEPDWQTMSFGGIYIEPTATAKRGRRPEFTAAVLGDSISGGSGTVSRLETWLPRAAHLVGCDAALNLSIGGTGFLTAAGSQFRDRVADVVASAADVVWIFGGQNDYAQTPAALLAEATYVIQQIQAGLPKALVFVVGMWSPGTQDATRTLLNDALRSAVTATGAAGFIDLIDPVGNGASAPAWAAATLYRPGDMVTRSGVSYVTRIQHTSTGSFDATKFQGTSIIYGTGKVGTTTGDGNADLMVQSDGVHPTTLGEKLLERHIAAETRRKLRAVATEWGVTYAA